MLHLLLRCTPRKGAAVECEHTDAASQKQTRSNAHRLHTPLACVSGTGRLPGGTAEEKVCELDAHQAPLRHLCAEILPRGSGQKEGKMHATGECGLVHSTFTPREGLHHPCPSTNLGTGGTQADHLPAPVVFGVLQSKLYRAKAICTGRKKGSVSSPTFV